MPTLGDLAKALNRPAVVLHNLQNRFALPAFDGAAYSAAYLAFLRTLVYLRTLNVSEETLLRLWELEKKLLQLLHVDTNGSPTWFLDACGQSTHRRRRLLLSNHDLGLDISGRALQLGLDFAARPPELFAGQEMGEDALRVLNDYLKVRARLGATHTQSLQLQRINLRGNRAREMVQALAQRSRQRQGHQQQHQQGSAHELIIVAHNRAPVHTRPTTNRQRDRSRATRPCLPMRRRNLGAQPDPTVSPVVCAGAGARMPHKERYMRLLFQAF